jgi:site-specific DNA-cytosine methylase
VFTRPATTIAGDTRVFQPGGHHEPGEQSANSIRLTIAELAKLQGFPDDYVWTGTKTDQARMIGNAVCPIMAQVLAEANRPVTR